MDNISIDLTTLVRCEKCSVKKPLKSFKRNKDGTPQGKKVCHSCRRYHEREKQRLWMQKYRIDYRAYTNQTARKSHLKARMERPESFFVYRAKQIAKRRNLPFNITSSDITIPDVCPVLGIKLEVGKIRGQATDCSPSIDRVIPELGYVKGNVEIISKRANTIKSFGTIEEHQKIIDYMRKHQVCQSQN